MKKPLYILLIAIVFASCDTNTKPAQTTSQKTEKKTVVVPAFNADSAYYFVEKQLAFGPRVPESKAHQQCAEWFVNTLNSYCDTVFVQDFKTRIYDKRVIAGRNIIASFNPEAKKRIIIASHWDSRPFADNDPDEANWRKPIDGANDGASGCGVMMEMARVLKTNKIEGNIGIDLIFFDLEDYGAPQFAPEEQHDNFAWALGSQHWAKNPHIAGYTAYYGILLDMVGASNPRFPKEYYSQQYASWVLNKVWRTAREMGYDEFFINELGQPINDDHIYVNHFAGIPMIDLIHLVDSEESSFVPYWHTLEDNLGNIDKTTLGMVGNVLMAVIFNS